MGIIVIPDLTVVKLPFIYSVKRPQYAHFGELRGATWAIGLYVALYAGIPEYGAVLH